MWVVGGGEPDGERKGEVNQRKVDRVLANHSLSSTASSRKVQHSPFFPALGTKPPGEEKCTGVKDGEGTSREMNDGRGETGSPTGDDKEIA